MEKSCKMLEKKIQSWWRRTNSCMVAALPTGSSCATACPGCPENCPAWAWVAWLRPPGFGAEASLARPRLRIKRSLNLLHCPGQGCLKSLLYCSMHLSSSVETRRWPSSCSVLSAASVRWLRASDDYSARPSLFKCDFGRMTAAAVRWSLCDLKLQTTLPYRVYSSATMGAGSTTLPGRVYSSVSNSD